MSRTINDNRRTALLASNPAEAGSHVPVTGDWRLAAGAGGSPPPTPIRLPPPASRLQSVVRLPSL